MSIITNIVLTSDYLCDINILTNKLYKVDSDNNALVSSNNRSLRLTQISTSKFILIIIVFLAGNRSYTAPILQYTLNSTQYTPLHYTALYYTIQCTSLDYTPHIALYTTLHKTLHYTAIHYTLHYTIHYKVHYTVHSTLCTISYATQYATLYYTKQYTTLYTLHYNITLSSRNNENLVSLPKNKNPHFLYNASVSWNLSINRVGVPKIHEISPNVFKSKLKTS